MSREADQTHAQNPFAVSKDPSHLKEQYYE